MGHHSGGSGGSLTDQWVLETCGRQMNQPVLIEAATETTLTGAQLVAAVHRAAQALVDAGVRPGHRVGICLPRGIDVVVAMLAVWSQGAAYVPLDPAFPTGRLALMAADAQIVALVALVAGDAEATLLPGYRAITPAQLRTAGSPPATQEQVRVPVPRSPEDTAYVIYTSGSTGGPKGVVITHANLTAFLQSWDAVVDPSAPGIWLAATTFSFDPSVVELMWTLWRGATVVLAPPVGMESLGELMMRFDVTHFQCTPSRARLLLNDPLDRTGLGHLQHLLIGGEALTAGLAARLFATGLARITNIYGPTETTVWSLAHEVDPMDLHDPIPIGLPLPGVVARISESGELSIGGNGVAAGYLGLPQLSAERFVTDADQRWYLTGDLVSLTDDGRYVFRGRRDDQVKLNGVRIELAEVETAVEAHPLVTQCVAAVVDDALGEACLVGWYVSDSATQVSPDELRSQLMARLPVSMVPRTLVMVNGFALTPTGKADRSALRLPVVAHGAPISMCADDVDALVADFTTVLGTGVHADSDFFDLGGQSLSAAWLATLIFDRTGLRMPLRAVVQASTPRQLAQWLGAMPSVTSDDAAEVLVRFRPRTLLPQLYVVHGAGGNVVGFHDLARTLADVTDVVGVQAIGVEPGRQLDASVEAMAQRYVAAIHADRAADCAQRASTAAPVLLGGYSGGGRVALEMAAQLLAEGLDVAPVALIDTFVSERLPASIGGRMAAVVTSAQDRGPHSLGQWARSSMAVWRARKDTDVELDSPDQVARYIDLEEAIDRTTMAAGPPVPVSCGAFLIRAQQTNPVFRLDYRWDPYLHSEVPVHWVAGGHLSLLQLPAVNEVATAIQNGMRAYL